MSKGRNMQERGTLTGTPALCHTCLDKRLIIPLLPTSFVPCTIRNTLLEFFAALKEENVRALNFTASVSEYIYVFYDIKKY